MDIWALYHNTFILFMISRMSFLKIYFALLTVVIIALFYGMAIRPRNVQLTSSVTSQQVRAPEPPKNTIDAYFPTSVSDVPEDDKMGPLGTCPPSKPFSTDLPLPNIPMCMARSKDNMKLHVL